MSVTFSRRVTVFDPTNGMVVDYLTRNAAIRDHEEGRLIPYLERDGQVIGVSRLKLRLELDAKPGSFGIHRNHMPCGAVIFEHNAHYGEVLAA